MVLVAHSTLTAQRLQSCVDRNGLSSSTTAASVRTGVNVADVECEKSVYIGLRMEPDLRLNAVILSPANGMY